MTDSAITKTIMDLLRHAKISDLESLDLAVLRQLENQANKDLDDAAEVLDWISSAIMGRVNPRTDGGNMQRKADIALVNASNRRQWISNIIDKKLGLESAANGTDE